MTQVINTVSVYRSLLQEEDYDIKLIAIQQLLANISLHWTDIANDINLMYIICYSEKNFLMMLISKIRSLWQSFLLRFISILMNMMSLSAMP